MQFAPRNLKALLRRDIATCGAKSYSLRIAQAGRNSMLDRKVAVTTLPDGSPGAHEAYKASQYRGATLGA